MTITPDQLTLANELYQKRRAEEIARDVYGHWAADLTDDRQVIDMLRDAALIALKGEAS